MRFKSALILALLATLANCGPRGQNRENTSLSGTTGFTNEQGIDYVSNGDTRVTEALKESEPVQPVPPKTTQRPAAKLKKPLREKIKAIEISRFSSGSTEPKRFGDTTVTLKVIFRGEKSVRFNTKLTGAKPKFQVNAMSGKFTLVGELNDLEQQTKGNFKLIETTSQDTAHILYWAYRGKLKIREDRTKKTVAGSLMEQQLKNLRENTFGWVNNWNVVRGPSFYLIDIVKIIRGNTLPDDPGSLLSFKGESLRTGEAVHDAEKVGGETAADVKLIGNGEEDAGRMFAITMQNPDTKENSEFMLDIELDDPQTTSPTAPPKQDEVAEEPEEFEPLVSQTPVPQTPASQQQQPAQPTTEPTQPETQRPITQKEEPAHTGKSFLRVNMSLPRTSKMTRDFNRNRNLSGVKSWMQQFQGNRRTDLEKFYTFASPFRKVMESVGQAFDVSPAYAYLTVIESRYFTGGRYEIEGAKGSSALGPFQLLLATAKEVGLYATENKTSDDERRFFVPSSCGAAKYIRKLVDKFEDSDSTVAILAYFQGDGGAAAAIYCSFDDNAGNRQACAKRINKSFSGSDYGRFLKLTKNYDYSYAEMDRMAAITKDMRDYVNKKLAIYFISNDMIKYGFEANSNRALPSNGTVIPRRALKDRACQDAIAGVLTGA